MMKRRLDPRKVRFHPASRVDDAGRLFEWEGALYRGIRPECASFYRELLSEGRIDEFFARGLVRTEIAPWALDGYGLVLKHDRVPFASYCMEWSAEMLRDAALLLCDLGERLVERGLTFKDAHPWNVLFDGGRPLFVDWGSIVRLRGSATWPYMEFRRKFLFPLWLASANNMSIARRLLFDVITGVRLEEAVRLNVFRTPPTMMMRHLWNDRRLQRLCCRPDRAFFRSLRQAVESIPLKSRQTEWTDYQGPMEPHSNGSPAQWPVRQKNVRRVLRALRPLTVLDVGSNKGWFSELACREGATVAALDVDESSLNVLYRRARADGMRILPLYMDVCFPTPPHGIGGGYAGARDRLKVDMVMALAVTHHLVFKRGMTFEMIAECLAAFAKKALLVEFVPGNDEHVRHWVREEHGWYTLDGFVAALRRHFRRIESFESTPAPRRLLLCER